MSPSKRAASIRARLAKILSKVKKFFLCQYIMHREVRISPIFENSMYTRNRVNIMRTLV